MTRLAIEQNLPATKRTLYQLSQDAHWNFVKVQQSNTKNMKVHTEINSACTEKHGKSHKNSTVIHFKNISCISWTEVFTESRKRHMFHYHQLRIFLTSNRHWGANRPPPRSPTPTPSREFFFFFFFLTYPIILKSIHFCIEWNLLSLWRLGQYRVMTG